MPISTLFNGKWLRTNVEDAGYEGGEFAFLRMLGRSKAHALLAQRSKEAQIVTQFFRNGVYIIQAHVHMVVLGIKEIEYGIAVNIDGKKQKQMNDKKGFGDCHSVSKFADGRDDCYITMYFLRPDPKKKDDCKKTMIVTRELKGENTTYVTIELRCRGKVTGCRKTYRRDHSWPSCMTDHEEAVLAVMHDGHESLLYR